MFFRKFCDFCETDETDLKLWSTFFAGSHHFRFFQTEMFITSATQFFFLLFASRF